jgi:hypothetical protein
MPLERVDAALMSPQRVVGEFGLSLPLMKRLRRDRAVRYVKIGHRTILYDRRSLAQFLESHAFEALPIAGERGAGDHE